MFGVAEGVFVSKFAIVIGFVMSIVARNVWLSGSFIKVIKKLAVSTSAAVPGDGYCAKAGEFVSESIAAGVALVGVGV